MSTEETPQRVEVPVERVEVKITLEDLLTALAAQSRTLSETGGALRAGASGASGVEQPRPPVAERLRKLSELARALKGEMDEIKQLDAGVASQLQQGSVRRPGGV